jgi:predicted Zn-dependent protease
VINEMGVGDVDAAERTLHSALEVYPDNSLLLSNRAIVLLRKKDDKAGKAAVADAMRVAPDSFAVRRVRAQVAVATGDPEARRFVDELLALDPDDPMSHALSGALAARGRHFGSALRSYEEAARLDPSDELVARGAQEARIANHPVLAPVRPIWRFGRWRSYFVYLSIFLALGFVGVPALRLLLGAIWLSLVILSRIGPRVLRRREERRLGGF